MVLIAAAVCNKAGKAILSRQFVEMTRARIEGILVAFPKLMTGGKQHTFVETDSVRYVYQPLEHVYMLLITTKASNILEDLETLRLFARVLPTYCKAMDEADVLDQAFNLIFAFDEIVALGYRESVTMSQIRTFTEMDSHEERVFRAVRETQEQEARMKARQRADELKKMRQEDMRRGGSAAAGMSYGGSGGFGSRSSETNSYSPASSSPQPVRAATKPAASSISSKGKSMKLGKGGTKDVDAFVDLLKSEGQDVLTDARAASSAKASAAPSSKPAVKQDGVHTRCDETISLTAGRGGDLESMVVNGMLKMVINDPQYANIKLAVNNQDSRGIAPQTHPNINKQLFASNGILAPKVAGKAFPTNHDVNLLRWKYSTTDTAQIPLTINCWPEEGGNGKCDVNIEFELENTSLVLEDVSITIRLTGGTGPPVVGNYDCGEYHHDPRKNILMWSIPVINEENKSGQMEFVAGGSPDGFFPVSVDFVSSTPFSGFSIAEIRSSENKNVSFSREDNLTVESYDVV